MSHWFYMALQRPILECTSLCTAKKQILSRPLAADGWTGKRPGKNCHVTKIPCCALSSQLLLIQLFFRWRCSVRASCMRGAKHSWLAEGGPEKCSPEHFTSKFKAKFIGWIYMAATKTPIKLWQKLTVWILMSTMAIHPINYNFFRQFWNVAVCNIFCNLAVIIFNVTPPK